MLILAKELTLTSFRNSNADNDSYHRQKDNTYDNDDYLFLQRMQQVFSIGYSQRKPTKNFNSTNTIINGTLRINQNKKESYLHDVIAQ